MQHFKINYCILLNFYTYILTKNRAVHNAPLCPKYYENKKFAIINMLFMGKHSLKNRTVLLLTHEFNTVIDAIYNMDADKLCSMAKCEIR